MVYVCSDIHGRYDKYIRVFDKVSDSDTLYILGDVIDRNPDGIKILQDIQKRDNVIFLCGNHEFMMYESLFGEYKEFSMTCQFVWQANGGTSTMKAFFSLSDDEKEEIKQMILSSLAFKRLTIKNKRYYLSHAGVFEDFPSCESKTFAELTSDILERGLFHINLTEGVSDDETIIRGHRVVQNYHNSYKVYRQKNNIDIDGGLALCDDSMSRLILFRLDDESVFYF